MNFHQNSANATYSDHVVQIELPTALIANLDHSRNSDIRVWTTLGLHPFIEIERTTESGAWFPRGVTLGGGYELRSQWPCSGSGRRKTRVLTALPAVRVTTVHSHRQRGALRHQHARPLVTPVGLVDTPWRPTAADRAR